MDQQKATIQIEGKSYDLPVVVGTENEKAVDITKLRAQSGYITLDDGFGNTGSVESKITFIDGDKGILRYRGIPIEQLAEHSTFVETAMLLIWGHLPSKDELAHFRQLLTTYERLHEGIRQRFNSFPPSGHPMAILSATINMVSCYHPDIMQMEDNFNFRTAAARLISKVRTIAAASFKASVGQRIVDPNPHLEYCRNFMHMMFSIPYKEYDADPDVINALQKIFILHADHEQNCSTSTVRMVCSSQANLFASCSAGVCALWGPLHGGANMAVLKMLQEMHDGQTCVEDYIERVKKREVKLMGFGHRVYKNFDPRAVILRDAAEKVLPKLSVNDPLLKIARKLEEAALSDSFFKDRNLYPNVDFYSGILLRAMGIPVNMFTVMFAIGRMPGWIAHWKEQHEDPQGRIFRPRQIYTGEPLRDYVPMADRK